MTTATKTRLPLDRIVVEHRVTERNIFKVLVGAYIRQYSLGQEDALFKTANTLKEVGALNGRKRKDKTSYTITGYGKALYNQALHYQ